MTYLEQYYKRLSEQLNERYINLQKLSLLLETPGIEDVKKHLENNNFEYIGKGVDYNGFDYLYKKNSN